MFRRWVCSRKLNFSTRTTLLSVFAMQKPPGEAWGSEKQYMRVKSVVVMFVVCKTSQSECVFGWMGPPVVPRSANFLQLRPSVDMLEPCGH